jgi:hypothetical protein
MHLDDETKKLPLRGRNLDGTTLSTMLGEEPVLLVFLRHLG